VENYFNYFTEIEECFRRCRGTPTLLSTLDWALIESWKEGGIPLEAAQIGIERAFHKFGRRPKRFKKINGLAYCSQQVLEAADELNAALAQGARSPGHERAAEAPFSAEEIRSYFRRNAEALEKACDPCRDNGQQILVQDLQEAAAELRKISPRETPEVAPDLEELERLLSALEEKLTASLTRASSVELLARFRGEVDRGLAPYRQKMTGAQIESLERQFMKKRLLEHYKIPRLSLFFL
jgi:hypothetical protein